MLAEAGYDEIHNGGISAWLNRRRTHAAFSEYPRARNKT